MLRNGLELILMGSLTLGHQLGRFQYKFTFRDLAKNTIVQEWPQ